MIASTAPLENKLNLAPRSYFFGREVIVERKEIWTYEIIHTYRNMTKKDAYFYHP